MLMTARSMMLFGRRVFRAEGQSQVVAGLTRSLPLPMCSPSGIQHLESIQEATRRPMKSLATSKGIV